VLEKKTLELNPKRINVVKELSPSIPPTQVDPKQIEQVLINLINNAEEAISEFHGFGEIRVKTKLMDDHIEITISDDGPGIPRENLSKLFDPLFSTKWTGIGLGLPISNDILAEHNGTMRVETEWGRGTTFIINLPMIKGETKKKVAKEINVEKGLKGMKGLVIDDDPTLLNFIYKYLELEGCEMTTAPDAQTALGILEVKDFDFVICDMKMPGMNGSDFYRIVKKRDPSLSDRIIFSTGDVLSETTKGFTDSVINPCIEKPFTLTELKKVISLHTGRLSTKGA
jgi:CheY-like chemotaxis protein/anti-sigma regulatory factor (Ser/Thr protein kinase)